METIKRFVRSFLELSVVNAVIVGPFANIFLPLLVVCIAIPLLSIIGAVWLTVEMKKWDRKWEAARRNGFKVM